MRRAIVVASLLLAGCYTVRSVGPKSIEPGSFELVGYVTTDGVRHPCRRGCSGEVVEDKLRISMDDEPAVMLPIRDVLWVEQRELRAGSTAVLAFSAIIAATVLVAAAASSGSQPVATAPPPGNGGHTGGCATVPPGGALATALAAAFLAVLWPRRRRTP